MGNLGAGTATLFVCGPSALGKAAFQAASRMKTSLKFHLHAEEFRFTTERAQHQWLLSLWQF